MLQQKHSEKSGRRLTLSGEVLQCKVSFTYPMAESVKNYVHQLRQEASLTQEELADVVGVTRQTIIAIERGNYTPSVLLALKLARAFKQPVDEVFSYEK